MKDLTVIMMTFNRVPKAWAAYHQQVISEAIGDTPIITISNKPLDWGTNLIQKEYGLPNLYRQMLRGSKLAKTEYIAVIDDDTLYPREHFEFRPSEPGFYYNFNRWHLFTWGEPFYFHKPRPGNGCFIGTRKLVIKAMETRMKADPDLKGYCVKELGSSLRMRKYDKLESKSFYTKQPIVSIYHEESIDEACRQHRKRAWPVRAYDIPLWGKAKELRKRFA